MYKSVPYLEQDYETDGRTNTNKCLCRQNTANWQQINGYGIHKGVPEQSDPKPGGFSINHAVQHHDRKGYLQTYGKDTLDESHKSHVQWGGPKFRNFLSGDLELLWRYRGNQIGASHGNHAGETGQC